MLSFVVANARWLTAGFLLALGSSFGQTYFISLYAGPIREAFGLTHGEWGAIYMVGTLASATALVFFGGLADTLSPRLLGPGVALSLAAVCVGMALAPHWLALPALIFGLRFFGQGMFSHLSGTLTARWFVATRGRALAVTNAGFPTGEALGPFVVLGLTAIVGWRGGWAASAAVLALGFAPLLWLLLARDRTPRAAPGSLPVEEGPGLDGSHWTRGRAAAHPLFWILLPGVMAPGWIITVLFFLPDHIAEAKGWAFEALAASYWVYAVASLAASASAGLFLDRFSARAALPLYQLPMAAGLLVFAFAEAPFWIPVGYALFGFTAGAAATTLTALWAELYGTRHLGAIKALAVAILVFSTAAGPGVAGVLIDLGVDFPEQARWMTVYAVVASAGYAFMTATGRLGDVGFGRRAA